jgi:hypothetical protein
MGTNQLQPEVIHKTRDVYGISRELPLNYVPRATVDGKFIDSLTREKHLIVHGGSKQGKTSLRKYNLNSSDYIVVACQNKWDIGELNAAILKMAGYQVTLSNSRTAAGKNKIAVKIEGKGKVPLIAEGGASGEYSNESTRDDLTWLFWTKRCEKISLERSLGHAEEAVQRGADCDAASPD